MEYQALLTRIIEDGIAEVREAYADPADHHKRDGAIEGFEACRGKTPAELVALHHAIEREAETARRVAPPSDDTARAFWRLRYKALQIEWVCNVVSAGNVLGGGDALLSHQPTARGVRKYAEIVGVSVSGWGADPAPGGIA